MSERDEFYAEFVGELSALDGFFDQRASELAHFKLDRQDPDVDRILEAMAFFTVRSRLLARSSFRDAVERLTRGQLDYLLTPMPAMALLQAKVKGLSAPAVLPRGEEVRLVTPDRATGVFTTTRRLDILPLGVHSAEVKLGRGRGHQLVIRLDASVPLRTPAEPLSIFIDYLGDYRASLHLLHLLERHVTAVKVAYDEDDDGRAVPCKPSFGAPRAADPSAADDDGVHPIERIRSFFHFPAQELFFNVALPPRASHFEHAYIYLDLDEEWPANLRVNKEVFQLFVVPVQNLRRADAQAITCDGTRDSYPVLDAKPVPEDGRPIVPTVVHSIVGVYQLNERGREPIPPGTVSDTGAVHDVQQVGNDPSTVAYRLLLEIPGAFTKPRKVFADARWYQPSFDAHAGGRLDPSLQMRRVEGVVWEIRGDLQPHRRSPLWNDAAGLLHVLSLKTRTVLSRDELVRLMRLLGADDKGTYRGIPDLVASVTVRESPERSRGGAPVKFIYEAAWREHEVELEGLVEGFARTLAAFLDAWIPDAVELRRASAEPAGRRPALTLLAGGARA